MTRHTQRQTARIQKLIWPLFGTFLCAFGAVAGEGTDELGMRGFTWGEIRYPSSEQPEEEDDLVIEGAIEQGIDIASLTKQTRLNLFGKLGYKFDSKNLDYNNKLNLAAGLKIRHYLSDSFVLDAGVRYEVERRTESNRTLNGPTFFTGWFGSWLLRCETCSESHLLARRHFPGLIWGELRFPGSQDPIEENDWVVEGAVEQGIDWRQIADLGTFNTFARVDYVADTDALEYNRSVSFAVGLKLKRKVGRVGLLQIGAQYLVDRRWESNVTNDVLMAFINWSAWWDPRAVRYDIPQ